MFVFLIADSPYRHFIDVNLLSFVHLFQDEQKKKSMAKKYNSKMKALR